MTKPIMDHQIVGVVAAFVVSIGLYAAAYAYRKTRTRIEKASNTTMPDVPCMRKAVSLNVRLLPFVLAAFGTFWLAAAIWRLFALL